MYEHLAAEQYEKISPFLVCPEFPLLISGSFSSFRNAKIRALQKGKLCGALEVSLTTPKTQNMDLPAPGCDYCSSDTDFLLGVFSKALHPFQTLQLQNGLVSTHEAPFKNR